MPLHLGTGFGAAKNGWNSNIWANGGRASAFTDGAGDVVPSTGRYGLSCRESETYLQSDSSSHSAEEEPTFEGKTGSGSLLSTSESDGWNGRSGLPWPPAVNNTSPILSRSNSHSISPLRQRNNDQSSLQMQEPNGRSLPSSSANRANFGQMADQAPQNLQLSSVLSSAPQGSTIHSFSGFENLRPSEEHQQFVPKAATFGSNAFVSSVPPAKHYSNTALDSAVRNSTVFQPTSSSRTNIEAQSGGFFRPSAFASKSNFSQGTASRAFHRHFHSTDASLDDNLQDMEDHSGGRHDLLASELERLNLQGNDQLSQSSRSNHRPTYSSNMSYDVLADRSNFRSVSNDRFSTGQVPYLSDSSPEHGFQYHPTYHRSTSYGNRGSVSSSISESRRELNPPFYSTASTPPMPSASLRASSGNVLSNRPLSDQIALAEKKMTTHQQYPTDQRVLQPNPLQIRPPYQQQCEIPFQGQIQMNPLARPYAMPSYPTYPNIQSGPSQNTRYNRHESEASQVIRSPLLEDFRTNSKTNKRYELKVKLFLSLLFFMVSQKAGYLPSRS